MNARVIRTALAKAFESAPRRATAEARMSRQQWAQAFGSKLDDTPEAALQRADEHFPVRAFRTMDQPYDEAKATGATQWFHSDPRVAQSYVEHVHGAAVKRGGARPTSMDARIKPGRSVDVDAGGAHWNKLGGAQLPDDVVEQLEKIAPHGRWSTNHIAEAARRAGYDSVTFRNVRDGRSTSNMTPIGDVTAVFKAQNIRSRFAKFDPARLNENNLTAGVAGAAAIPTGLAAHEAVRRRRSEVRRQVSA